VNAINFRFFGTFEVVDMDGKDVIKYDFGGKLPSGRPFRPDVRPHPHLSRGRGFTCGRVFTVRRRGKNRVHANAKKLKIKN
jgi:hypothetical protein